MTIIDPNRKKIPEQKTGTQNDLPMPRCLIVFMVLKLRRLRTKAVTAIGISRMSTIAITSMASLRNLIKKL